MNALMELRTLEEAEEKGEADGEYYMGVDVARSEDATNNQCSVAVVRVIRNSSGRITRIKLVNIINIPSVLNFKVQAQEVMKIRNRYNVSAVILDRNGLGIGLEDALVNEQVDPVTGESLGCWKTINTDKQSELPDAEEILYSLTSQGINSDIIVNFIDMVESEKLQLLEKRADDGYDKKTLEETRKSVVPYLETDFLLEEIANLKLVTRGNGKFKVERQTRGIDDDRYHALAYVLWYIQTFESDYSTMDANAEPLGSLFIN